MKTTIEELLAIAHDTSLTSAERIRKVLCKLDFHDDRINGGLLDQQTEVLLEQWHEGYASGKRTMKTVMEFQ